MEDPSPLVSWVKYWFNDPGCIDTPDKQRKWIYVATTVLIGRVIKHNSTRDDLRTIHEFLTYLLLGWNPITAWPDPSDYDEPDQDDDWNKLKECGYDRAVESMRGFLNFEADSCRTTNLYGLVATMSKVGKEIGSRATVPFVGEHVTMLMLAHWLLDRSTEIPSDISLIRACMDLSYSEKRIAPVNSVHEYASTNNDVRYSAWFCNQIDRLLKLNVPSDEFRRSLAYLSWFSALVRSKRILFVLNRDERWKEEVDELYNEQVNMMRGTLDNIQLKCDEDKVRDGSSLNASSKLFKLFRIKPPPVKIK